MASGALVEEASLYRLPFTGARVARVSVDAQLALYLAKDSAGWEWMGEICVNGPFRCGLPANLLQMDVEVGDRASVGPALNLFYSTIAEAIAHKDGRLAVRFAGGRPRFPVDGWLLEVAPDDQFEAWEVRGSDGLLIVGCPGGELAVFSDPPIGTVGEMARKGFFDKGVFNTDR